MSFVLDASATLAFVFPDERDAAALAIAARLRDEITFVPMIWLWEVQNAVVTVERSGRLTAELATQLLDDIACLPVQQQIVHDDYAALARAQKLSIYDSLYLQLAMQNGVPLATRDSELVRAARSVGVEVLKNG